MTALLTIIFWKKRKTPGTEKQCPGYYLLRMRSEVVFENTNENANGGL